MKKYTVEELTKIFAEHPYIPQYYTEEDRQRILNNPLAEPYLQNVREMYDKYTEKPIVALPFTSFKRYYKDGNRKEGEFWYFYNRSRLGTVALMAWLYQKEEYYGEVENSLWAMMDEYVWNIPAHIGDTALTELQEDSYIIDLFSAETCSVIAEILSVLGDKLEPVITKRAERMINERCFDVLDKPFWWKKSTNNWSAVCAGHVGMTAICMKRDPAELAKIIHTCLDTMEYFLSGYPNDGACTEGLGYWGYGFGNYTHFGYLLHERTEGAINLFEDEKVRRIANFPRKCFFKDGRIITFSDCGGNPSRFDIALTLTLNKFYPEITLPERERISFHYGDGPAFGTSIRTLFWLPDSFEGKALEYGTHILPDAQWYISSADNGLGIAAKAGSNWERFESHNHNDIGGFIIYKNGRDLVADIGGGVYNSTYFDPAYRYDNFACSSAGHSVPMIDGNTQKYGEKFRAKNTVITEENGLTADISGAYDVENLESLVRNIRLDQATGKVYLKDTYKFKAAPTSVVERFISYIEPSIENGVATITNDGETLTFGYDKSVVKPVVRVFEDQNNQVRHRDGFKAYMLDFEVLNPSAEFTVEFTLE